MDLIVWHYQTYYALTITRCNTYNYLQLQLLTISSTRCKFLQQVPPQITSTYVKVLQHQTMDLTSCTCMFLSFYMQLDSLFIIFVYRVTHIFTTSLHTKFYVFYMHMYVLAVIRVITTCTSIDSPRLDHVM